VRLLAADPPNLAEVREAVEAMIRDGYRASDVIRRIRALVQQTPLQPEWLEVNALILEVLALVRGDVQGQSIVLHTDLAQDLPRVRGDRIQVQQVLLNLFLNAIDALRGVPEGVRALEVSSGSDAAQGVRVTVCDTGIGLAAASLAHLFDAFYTTKPEGMGLGLAISRRIIEAHGGQLWATPNAGPGATFQFTLPVGGEQVS
jgi:signal transduction histidine kinase